jgi:hypothetical protein
MGNLLISGGWEETIFLWSIKRFKLLKKINLDMGPIANIQTDDLKIISVCREEGFQHQLTIVSFASNYK